MKTKNLVIVAVLAVALLLFACSPTQEAAVAEDVKAPSTEETVSNEEVEVPSAEEMEVTVPVIAGDVSVIGPEGFTPMEFSVKVGESVTFVNNNADDVDVVDDVVLVFKEQFTLGNAKNSPTLKVGEAYTHTFSKAGIFEVWTVGYGVKGIITVTE